MIAQIIKHSFIYVGLEALNKSMPFILMPILTYYLSPSEMGLVGQFTALIGIMGVLVGLSTHGAVSVAYFREDIEYLRSYIFNIIMILLATTIIAISLSLALKNVVEPFIGFSIKWIIIATLACCGQFLTLINLVLWQAQKKPLMYGLYQIAISVLYFSLAYFSVGYFQLSWEGVAASFSIVYIIFGFISLFFLYCRGFVRTVLDKQLAKDALAFGIPLMPHALSGWFFLGFNIFLTKKVLGDEMAGLMNISMQFSLIISVVALAINRAYSPIVFEHLKSPTQEIKRMLVKVSYLGIFLMGFLGTFIYLIIKYTFPWLVAPEYQSAMEVIPTLIFASTINACYFFVSVFIFYEKKTGALAITTIIAAIMHVILSIILIEYYGIMGIAFSLLVVSILRFFMVWLLSASVYKMPWFSWSKGKLNNE